MIASGIYNQQGRQMSVQEVLANPTIQNATNATGSATACACPSTAGGTGGKIYKIPSQFTLNATGTGANVKLQAFDNTPDSIQGTLGANIFTVSELPDRAGLALGGAALLGVDVLRGALATYAARIAYVNYNASASSQLANPLKVYRGCIDGTIFIESKSVSASQSNMQFNAALIPINGEWLLTANTSLQMMVNNGVTVNLTFSVNGLVPYNTVL